MTREDIAVGMTVRNRHDRGQRGDVYKLYRDKPEYAAVIVWPQDCGWQSSLKYQNWLIEDLEVYER